MCSIIFNKVNKLPENVLLGGKCSVTEVIYKDFIVIIENEVKYNERKQVSNLQR